MNCNCASEMHWTNFKSTTCARKTPQGTFKAKDVSFKQPEIIQENVPFCLSKLESRSGQEMWGLNRKQVWSYQNQSSESENKNVYNLFFSFCLCPLRQKTLQRGTEMLDFVWIYFFHCPVCLSGLCVRDLQLMTEQCKETMTQQCNWSIFFFSPDLMLLLICDYTPVPKGWHQKHLRNNKRRGI